ncbi:MAG: hypothetical protein GVY02_05860 [Bacteroidetes bacterium]|nr:hypothetical protein [Bacteroidota bacterium]
MIVRNNVVQSQSGVEYHVATHAQDYAEQLLWIQDETELNNFLNDFPRVDSVSFDEDNPNLMLAYEVQIEASDTTIPGSSVTNKVIELAITNDFLEKKSGGSGTADRAFRLKLIKSFDN